MPRITVFADTKHLKKRHQNTVLDGYARYEAYCHYWLIVWFPQILVSPNRNSSA